jgi:hypothetical protein
MIKNLNRLIMRNETDSLIHVSQERKPRNGVFTAEFFQNFKE